MDDTRKPDEMIGIVLLINPTAVKAAITLSRKLTRKEAAPQLVLSAGQTAPALPHISMIHLVKPADISGLVDKLSRINGLCGNLLRRDKSHQFTGLGLRRNWVFWETPRMPGLDHLHDFVISSVQSFLVKPVDVTWPMSEAQQRMHEMYGYPSCGECFDPHVTLAVFPPDDVDEELVRAHSCRQYWSASAFAIAEIGPQGRVSKILHQFPLS